MATGLLGGIGALTGATLGYTAGTNCVTCNNVWQSWNQQTYTIGTGTTIATTNTVWYAWNDEYAQYATQQQVRAQLGQVIEYQPSLSVEEIREAQRQLEASQRAAQEQRETAEAKARELLLDHLSPAQRANFEAHRLFIVEGKKANYQLGYNAAPRRIDRATGKHTHTYCIHCSGVPKDDELLAFKLLLEADEELFLKTANATRIAA